MGKLRVFILGLVGRTEGAGTAPRPRPRRGRSGAGRCSVLPFSHNKQGRAGGLLFPRGFRAPFPTPDALSEGRFVLLPPAPAGGSLHCPLGRCRILHDAQSLCRKRQYRPRCLLNKFQVFFSCKEIPRYQTLSACALCSLYIFNSPQ